MVWAVRSGQRGDHERLDGVQPVFRLIEDDASAGFEDLVGHLEPTTEVGVFNTDFK